MEEEKIEEKQQEYIEKNNPKIEPLNLELVRIKDIKEMKDEVMRLRNLSKPRTWVKLVTGILIFLSILSVSLVLFYGFYNNKINISCNSNSISNSTCIIPPININNTCIFNASLICGSTYANVNMNGTTIIINNTNSS